MYIKHNFLIALLRFSFEWNNPTGYLFASAIQYMIVTFVFYFVACSSTIAIAVYLFTMDATNDIIENLQSINEAAKSEENLSNAMIQIAEFIEYHSILKQLSQHVLRHIDTTVHSWCSFWKFYSHRSMNVISKVFQPKSVILLSFSVVLLGCTMLTIQIVNDRNIDEILFACKCS